MTESNFKILVVEDEMALAEGLIFNLKRKGYEVEHEANGAKAFETAKANRFDLILLDIRLPDKDGFSVCQDLRRERVLTPILMLTARDQQDDIVFGLKSGADDYITKPFDLGELLARVESFSRRKAWIQSEGVKNAKWKFGNFWIDFESWKAKTLKGEVDLSKKEVEVLRVFQSKIGQVVSRKELLEKAWGLPNHPNERIVDNVIVALRKHFEKDSQKPEHILNVWGEGYRFSEG